MKTKNVISKYKHNLTKYDIQECKMGLTGLHDSLVHGMVSSFFVILCSLNDIFKWQPLLGASIKILLSNGFLFCETSDLDSYYCVICFFQENSSS